MAINIKPRKKSAGLLWRPGTWFTVFLPMRPRNAEAEPRLMKQGEVFGLLEYYIREGFESGEWCSGVDGVWTMERGMVGGGTRGGGESR